MTRCGFGYPVKPGSKTVFFCDDEATCAFNQPVAGVPGYVVRVRVCDEHAEWLRFEYLLQNAVSQSPRVLPCVCGEPDAPGVHHRLSGPCHVDLSIETHETRTDGDEHIATVVVQHEHTDALCGHDLTTYDPGDGSHACLACDEINPRTTWCHEKCAVFLSELVTQHEHTEAECGHVVPDLTVEGELSCWVCGEHKHEPLAPWCHVRCAVFHAEVVESVKLAERAGDFPAHADETMTEREDDTR